MFNLKKAKKNFSGAHRTPSCSCFVKKSDYYGQGQNTNHCNLFDIGIDPIVKQQITGAQNEIAQVIANTIKWKYANHQQDMFDDSGIDFELIKEPSSEEFYDDEEESNIFGRIYHGTSIDKLESIKKGGLLPLVGKFIMQFYGEYEDDLEEVVYMAEEEKADKAISAMVAQVGFFLGKDLWDVTLNEVKKYGVIFEVDASNDIYRLEEDGSCIDMENNVYYDEDIPLGVESGDLFSRGDQSVLDEIIVGESLIDFMIKYDLRYYNQLAKNSNSKLRWKYAQSSDPLELNYGGMPTGGGYSSATEYEIGAQRIAEETHCILGSLFKIVIARKGLESFDIEIGHIMEELGLILKDIEEYGRDVYIEDGFLDKITGPPRFSEEFFDSEEDYQYYMEGYEQRKAYVYESVESIKKKSPILKEKAIQAKQNLPLRTELVYEIAAICYDVLIALADAMERSIQNFPQSMENAFLDPQLRLAISQLEEFVNKGLNRERANV